MKNILNNLPIKLDTPIELITLIGESNSALARYDGILKAVPNPRILLSTLIEKESEVSSKIEGTQASFKNVLEHEAGQYFEEEVIMDIGEIKNYRYAMINAQESLEEGRPLSLSLILAIHQQLLQSVRGGNKTPGQFRTEQNWIGKAGCSIEEASYVPPAPLLLRGYLENWEQYLKSDDIDPLYQVAIIHAQFEMIHPFMDGNGRIGRLLIPLFLFNKKRLGSPNFYLSEYLESHRDEYIDKLGAISREDKWMDWILFFLKAIISQSNINTARVEKIMALYEDMKNRIHLAINSSNTIKILDALFERPIFTSGYIGDKLEIQRTSASSIIKKLVDDKIIELIKKGSGRKASIYQFSGLLNIVS